jgi:methylated-DNA-protein-cysteine methyltransferase-like protein
MEKENNFRDNVYKIVASIPSGRVMTYGQIAVMCGKPRAARIVGGIAHYGDTKLPWHRVVRKGGYLAEGYPGGVDGHRKALESEGVMFDKNGKIADTVKCTWLSDYKIV